MRYLGNKTDMLKNISEVIQENITDEPKVFLDLFAGTGSVSTYFKNKYSIIANDFLYFSYALIGAYIKNNNIPSFDNLLKIGISDPVYYLNNIKPSYNSSYFITKNYSPYENNPRMYFSVDNAKKIDAIRQKIEIWFSKSLISEEENLYLIAILIEATSKVSNTSGTYGAYLKKWDPRSLKDIVLEHFILFNNGKENSIYNDDANYLVKNISSDICYLDPPYNGRQYSSNYHILETIARYDSPELKGVTGMRSYSPLYSSSFSKKTTATKAFEDLIKNINARHIILSYSSDGLLSIEDIEKILKKYGVSSTYKSYKYLYKKYQSKIQSISNELYEFIFYIEKKSLTSKLTESESEYKEKELIEREFLGSQMDFFSTSSSSLELIASPMNYIGGKFKLLPQLLPLFPNLEESRFIDLFAGGLNVSANVNCKEILANDLNKYVIEVVEYFYNNPIEIILSKINKLIDEYSLSKENHEGFIRIREDYNKNKNPIMLYTLICYSFNYQFRFNNSHDYNNPFGKNRSQFSESLKRKLIKFVKRIQSKKINFISRDFYSYIDCFEVRDSDFFYCDPPYLITTGSYNDGNRGFRDWGVSQEESLLFFLDELNDKNIKFALSNVLEHKGRSNDILKKWAKKYNINFLSKNYSNSSYNTKKGDSLEVLVTNY